MASSSVASSAVASSTSGGISISQIMGVDETVVALLNLFIVTGVAISVALSLCGCIVYWFCLREGASPLSDAATSSEQSKEKSA